jgi:restriction endonuclease S subunit
MDLQKSIVDVLWAMERVKCAYKELISKTDELVKSQFIEMFGDLADNPNGYNLAPLSELLSIERGGSPRPISKFVTEAEDGVNWIKIGDADEGSIYITHTKEKITIEGAKKSRYVRPGDFLLSNSMSFGRPYILAIDGYIHDGWLVLRDEKERFDKMFLLSMLSSSYATMSFESMAAGSVVKNLNKDLVGKLLVPVPPIEEQKRYAEFLVQSDKSKNVANKATILNGFML